MSLNVDKLFNDLEDKLIDIGVQIKDSEGQYRNLDVITDEIVNILGNKPFIWKRITRDIVRKYVYYLISMKAKQ